MPYTMTIFGIKHQLFRLVRPLVQVLREVIGETWSAIP
jgi:hypothetical protein